LVVGRICVTWNKTPLVLVIVSGADEKVDHFIRERHLGHYGTRG